MDSQYPNEGLETDLVPITYDEDTVGESTGKELVLVPTSYRTALSQLSADATSVGANHVEEELRIDQFPTGEERNTNGHDSILDCAVQGPPTQTTAAYDELLPRLEVHPSMLFAYAKLRGPVQPVINEDPLYSALYPQQSRFHYPYRIWIPPMPGATLGRLPSPFTAGAKFWYDPLVVVRSPQCNALQMAPTPGDRRPLSLTYEESIRQNPPLIGRNHTKGDQVYSNFGYLPAGKGKDRWCDPDSERDLYNAGMDLHTEDTTFRLQDLPEAHGAGIMTVEQEEEYYDWYTQYVSDDEGDPRDHHLSTAAFLRMSSGAKLGDTFAESVLQPQSKLPLADWTDAPAKPQEQVPDYIFDEETGDALSGIWEENSPTLLRKPQGVDMIRPPLNFSYMAPDVLVDMENKAFAPTWNDRTRRSAALQSSPASSPETLTSARFRNNIQNLRSTEYDEKKERTLKLRAKNERNVGRIQDQWGFVSDAHAHKIDLGRQVFFLRKRLEEGRLKNPAKFSTYPRIMTLEDAASPVDGSLNAQVPVCDSSQERFHKSYRRHTEEQLRNEIVTDNKNKMIMARVEADHLGYLADVAKLTQERDALLDALGVEDIADIEGFIVPGHIFEKSPKAITDQEFDTNNEPESERKRRQANLHHHAVPSGSFQNTQNKRRNGFGSGGTAFGGEATTTRNSGSVRGDRSSYVTNRASGSSMTVAPETHDRGQTFSLYPTVPLQLRRRSPFKTRYPLDENRIAEGSFNSACPAPARFPDDFRSRMSRARVRNAIGGFPAKANKRQEDTLNDPFFDSVYHVQSSEGANIISEERLAAPPKVLRPKTCEDTSGEHLTPRLELHLHTPQGDAGHLPLYNADVPRSTSAVMQKIDEGIRQLQVIAERLQQVPSWTKDIKAMGQLLPSNKMVDTAGGNNASCFVDAERNDIRNSSGPLIHTLRSSKHKKIPSGRYKKMVHENLPFKFPLTTDNLTDAQEQQQDGSPTPGKKFKGKKTDFGSMLSPPQQHMQPKEVPWQAAANAQGNLTPSNESDDLERVNVGALEESWSRRVRTQNVGTTTIGSSTNSQHSGFRLSPAHYQPKNPQSPRGSKTHIQHDSTVSYSDYDKSLDGSLPGRKYNSKMRPTMSAEECTKEYQDCCSYPYQIVKGLEEEQSAGSVHCPVVMESMSVAAVPDNRPFPWQAIANPTLSTASYNPEPFTPEELLRAGDQIVDEEAGDVRDLSSLNVQQVDGVQYNRTMQYSSGMDLRSGSGSEGGRCGTERSVLGETPIE